MTPSPQPERRTIGVLGAYIEGWRRVLKAPALWIGLVLVWFVTSVAPGGHVSARLDVDVLAGGNFFRLSAADGSARLVRLVADSLPRLIDPSTAVVDAFREYAPVDAELAAGVTWRLVLWLFLLGGVLDRLARARPVGSAAFFAACGVYLWRFLRLAVPLALLYWIVAGFLSPYAMANFIALFLLLIFADFARVRAVVEDRHSMIGALVSSWRFVRSRSAPIVGLVLLNVGSIAALFALGDFENWSGLGELSEWVRYPVMVAGAILLQGAALAAIASEVVYFQHALAHADYTAAPLPMWPDSPAAEAIENLARQRDRTVLPPNA